MCFVPATAITGALGKSATVDTSLHNWQIEPVQPSQLPKHDDRRFLEPPSLCNDTCPASLAACSQSPPLCSYPCRMSSETRTTSCATGSFWSRPSNGGPRKRILSGTHAPSSPQSPVAVVPSSRLKDPARVCDGTLGRCRLHGRLRYFGGRDHLALRLLLRRWPILRSTSLRVRRGAIPGREHGPGGDGMKTAVGQLLGGRCRISSPRRCTGSAPEPAGRATTPDGRQTGNWSRGGSSRRDRFDRHPGRTTVSPRFIVVLCP